MWDNARPHSAHETQVSLVHRDIQPVKQPAYNLNLCNRFLFRKIKHRLKGYDFGGHEDVKDCSLYAAGSKVTRVLHAYWLKGGGGDAPPPLTSPRGGGGGILKSSRGIPIFYK